MNVIREQNNRNASTFTSQQENSIWFDVRKPVESFTGRKRKLQNLHIEVQCKKRTNQQTCNWN